MSFFERMFGGAPSEKTPQEKERDELAEKALADAEKRGMSGGEVIDFKGSADEPVKKSTSYTGQGRKSDERAA